jgi:hypothetical protein
MKNIIKLFLLLGILPQLYGQGTVFMSNIGRGQILLDGVPVAGGEAVVFIANLDGERISQSVKILGSGVFSGGGQVLDGYQGRVRLKLGVVYLAMPEAVIFSDPFDITLGGSGVPPSPAAYLPPITIDHKLDIELPEPERTWPVQTDKWITINQQESAKFYRADQLEIVATGDGAIGVRFYGSLEVSDNTDGPWTLVE